MITRLAQAALRMESVAVIKAWSWLETHTHTKTGSLVHFERLVESERKKKKTTAASIWKERLGSILFNDFQRHFHLCIRACRKWPGWPTKSTEADEQILDRAYIDNIVIEAGRKEHLDTRVEDTIFQLQIKEPIVKRCVVMRERHVKSMRGIINQHKNFIIRFHTRKDKLRR